MTLLAIPALLAMQGLYQAANHPSQDAIHFNFIFGLRTLEFYGNMENMKGILYSVTVDLFTMDGFKRQGISQFVCNFP